MIRVRFKLPQQLVRPCGLLEWCAVAVAAVNVALAIQEIVTMTGDPTGPVAIAACCGLLIRVRRLERIERDRRLDGDRP